VKRAFPFALPEDSESRDQLAEVGRIAGGLVHELKNPLGVILLNAELLEQQQPFSAKERERADKRLRRIRDSAEGLSRIIQSFLAFARPSRPDREAIDVNGLLQRLLDEQAEATERAQIKVAFHPDPDLALIPADQQQLRSIFANVLDNAREALGERARDRRLLVVTRHAPGVTRIVIANNGPPLSEDVATHLFEPFHSSKETGTGLGLSIVHRLVELHRGTVTVSSDPDQGVSFTFEFPTPLGPAHPRPPLPMPMPEVEGVVRSERVRGPDKVRGPWSVVRGPEAKPRKPRKRRNSPALSPTTDHRLSMPDDGHLPPAAGPRTTDP